MIAPDVCPTSCRDGDSNQGSAQHQLLNRSRPELGGNGDSHPTNGDKGHPQGKETIVEKAITNRITHSTLLPPSIAAGAASCVRSHTTRPVLALGCRRKQAWLPVSGLPDAADLCRNMVLCNMVLSSGKAALCHVNEVFTEGGVESSDQVAGDRKVCVNRCIVFCGQSFDPLM